MNKLQNQRQELFCQYYFTGEYPAYECALKAGYALKASRQIASRLLTYANIQARILELNEQASSKRVMTKRERMERLSEIGRAKLTDFINADGEPTIDKKALNVGAISKFIHRTRYTKLGDQVIENSIELRDPVSAIQELNKMDGAYTPTKGELNVIVKYTADEFTDDQLATIATGSGYRTIAPPPVSPSSN